MKNGGAVVLKGLVVSLFIAALAVPWAVGAENQKGSANHPPGFVMPAPNEVIRLWPGDAPNLVPGGRAETVVNERYRDVSVPQLFVYLPPNDKAKGTALIICAGGGYTTWRCAFTSKTL